jgi:hypothetical protein
MAWRISGTYLAELHLPPALSVPVDGPPTSDDGRCHGTAVFQIAHGNRDDTAPGKVSVFGMDFETIYGESADYEFSREAPEGAPAGRG